MRRGERKRKTGKGSEKSRRLAAKARQVRLLILDVDGVLTDGRIVYGSGGAEWKAFDVHDGYGIKAAQRAGLTVALLTSRSSEVVERRAKELGVEELIQGQEDKGAAYEALLRRYHLTDAAAACVGDDLPDLPVLRRAGLAVAVAGAVAAVKREADYVTTREGGRGAVREVIDLILAARRSSPRTFS